jgi:leucyl-tRNA synthetase
LAPFAPHLSEELWDMLSYLNPDLSPKIGERRSLFVQKLWPKYDERYLVQDTITMAIQFNGKVRGTVLISPSAGKDEVVELIKLDEKMVKYLE